MTHISVPSLVAPIMGELSPTEYLLLEVLAARWRLGHQFWTFPSIFKVAAKSLESSSLVVTKPGVVPYTILVWLTDAGREKWGLNSPE